MLHILLIDDDVYEEKILTIHLKKAGFLNFKIIHVTKCSEAVQALLLRRFDIILLDNMLSGSISAEFSVPFIKDHLAGTPLIIISNDTHDYYFK